MSENLSAFAYLVASVCFIMALRGLSSPVTARRGNLLGVLMTAALLSLGAPFWFQMLHQLSGLRDALSPEKDSKAKGGPSQPQPAQIQVQVVGPAPPEAPATEGANPEATTAERDH